jgi:hypothetical protein
MAKGKSDPKWKEKVLAWKKSNKTASDWCRENKIPLTTLTGWRKRFDQADQNQPFKINQPFIELKNSSSSNSGISLECNGIKIHLEPEFDMSVLKQCLACLREVIC